MRDQVPLNLRGTTHHVLRTAIENPVASSSLAARRSAATPWLQRLANLAQRCATVNTDAEVVVVGGEAWSVVERSCALS